MSDLYDDDVLAWSERQAMLLRRRAANEIDWDHVAEEIEAVGVSQKLELRSRLEVLLLHLLKWAYQPEHRSESWRGSIAEQRNRLAAVMEDSPSLRGFVPEAMPRSYRLARLGAARETTLLRLPDECPWTFEQIADDDFWPEA